MAQPVDCPPVWLPDLVPLHFAHFEHQPNSFSPRSELLAPINASDARRISNADGRARLQLAV